MEDTLILSAGRGPIEVRRFVHALAAHLVGLGARELGRHGDPPASVRLALLDGARWLGTHVLISSLRGRGARKRWFARADLAPLADASAPLDAREVAFSASRAGGPGGQNVNKRSTAVRAVHGPTGLAVRSAGERSQARNRAAALRALESALEAKNTATKRSAEAATRALHDGLERGRATFVWRLNPDGALELT